MFGYIKPFRPQLRVCELETYKAVYCGLCGQLGKSFGAVARLTLSYDFTFFCMLAYAVGGETPSFGRRRCYVNPLKKIPACDGSEVLCLGADLATIMIYYKLLDNLADQRGASRLGWWLLRPFAARLHRKAAAARPEQDAIVARSMEQQRLLEERRCDSVDQAAEPTAAAMAAICRLLSDNGEEQRTLERLGYLVGRFVYLCDALDDLEGDAAKGRYNPYALRYDLYGDAGPQRLGEAREAARASLYGSIAEAAKAYDLLRPGAFAPILENILLLGMRASVDEILANKSKKEKSR